MSRLIHTNREYESVLMKAMASGADFAELFFEDQDERMISCPDGRISGVRTKHIHGVGLYVLKGIKSLYLYSNDTSIVSLMALADKANRMMAYLLKETIGKTGLITLREKQYPNPNSIIIYPGTVSNQDKIKVVKEIYRSANLPQAHVKQLDVAYFDTDRRIEVINSEGLMTNDRRITSRIRLGITCGDANSSFYRWEDYTRAQGFEAFKNNNDLIEFTQKTAFANDNMRKAQVIEGGVMPVVLEAGACGTLWHECCGHTLEATAIASRDSHFVGKIGEQIASEKVTLIDDGTMAGYYGTDAIDDEGTQKRKNILIEKGVLKSYMCDRLHGRMIGSKSTGNGRRQNYTYAPVARMTNTFLAPGKDDEEEIVRSVPYGLYVTKLGGGFGGTQFSIQVEEGFLIKNGHIDRQVKGLMLTGDGAKVMNKVDRVGSRLGFDGGGFCGAASGLVPTTSFQPMVRISQMQVG